MNGTNRVSKEREAGKVGEAQGALWKEYIKAGVVALALALFIRAFVAQAFKIPSESMVPTLLVGDHLLVNKIVYRIWEPQRGDIIVFEYPMDPSRDFVKRAVGLPGEVVEVKGDTVYINNQPLKEPYAFYEKTHPFGGQDNYQWGPYKVPAGHLLMLGDNRNNSQDSRVWGPLDMRHIHGRAFIIHWSWKDSAFGVRWDRVGKLLR
ncbi:MAG: signal peptidase I [Nitrospinae bacterium]|nr:signal peptidase I [Nitrospinota bacterium]